MMWLQYFVGVLAWLLAMLFHEFAHLRKAQRLGYDAHIRFEREPGRWFPDVVTVWDGEPDQEHEKQILMAGVFIGFVPILFVLLLLEWFGSLVVIMDLILYYIVSRSDIARLLEIVEVEEDDLQ